MHLLLQHDLYVIARGCGIGHRQLRGAVAGADRVALSVRAAPPQDGRRGERCVRASLPAPRQSLEPMSRLRDVLRRDVVLHGRRPTLVAAR